MSYAFSVGNKTLSKISILDRAFSLLLVIYEQTKQVNFNLMRKFVELAVRHNVKERSFTGMLQLELSSLLLPCKHKRTDR